MAATRRKQVAIHDVARTAGVSITTVSHSLSGKGRVNEETRERVRLVARELGYRANALAQGLASGGKGLLALQVSGAAGPPLMVSDIEYFAELMNAATLRALEDGYWLVHAPPTARADAWAKLQPDGAVIVDPVAGDPLLGILQKQRIPVVTTGRASNDDKRTYWVDNDHTRGTRSMLDHLEQAGATRIALMMAPPVYSYTVDSQLAYDTWMREHGAEPVVAVVSESVSEGAAYGVALELLESSPRPDAIYATLDRLALGALRAAQSKGLSVPGELLIAGLADSEAARSSQPSLTTLGLRPDEIGRHAVEMLIALVERRPVQRRHRLVPTEVISRASTLPSEAPARRRQLRT
jgi:DNA-binding LacI/PurR family transcriptional regulator